MDWRSIDAKSLSDCAPTYCKLDHWTNFNDTRIKYNSCNTQSLILKCDLQGGDFSSRLQCVESHQQLKIFHVIAHTALKIH